jgi:arylsulfatase A-like enzyme/tetratricopeptide (TPR) repeat protein
MMHDSATRSRDDALEDPARKNLSAWQFKTQVKPLLKSVACLLFLLPQLFAATASSRKLAPNVLLVTIDTVRADHIGSYGAKDVQTPTIDSLVRDGILFERAISQVPLTWPSHAVILTGTYPFQNGVQDFTGQPLAPQFRSVAQAFKRHGYATGAVISAFVLDRSWGLARGFDFYDDAFSPEEFQKRDLGLVDRKAGESVTHAINWLKQPTRRPFFFWLHLYDPHSPYDPPEPYRTQYRDHLYDGEIAYADHELGRLITWLKSNRLYDRTMIVLLSDHGESLGDHGEKEHGFFVYNSTVHVPLIVKPRAGGGIRPGRVARPVETTAVAPALLLSAGIKDGIEKQFNSRGLLGGVETEKPDSAYSETFYPLNSFGWSPLHALETSRYHYIEAPQPELYDLTSDPAEKTNIITSQSATASVLKEKLHSIMQHNPYNPPAGGNSNLGPDALEKLRALGYVAYHSPVSPEALAAGLPDPKTKLEEFNSILAAEDAFHANDFDKGEQLLAKVRDQDPKMYIVPFMLGEAANTRRDWPEAEADFKSCLELNPNFDQAMTGLSRVLMYQNKDEEAKQWARNALKYNPENYRAWYELAFIESKTDKQAAIAHYEKAVAIQGNFAPLRRDLGLLYYQQRNYAEAAKHLAKAAELGMDEAPLWNVLGISYRHSNRLSKAVESYKQALKLDPDLADAHLNLAYAYETLQHPTLARKEYETACRLQKNFCQYIPGD